MWTCFFFSSSFLASDCFLCGEGEQVNSKVQLKGLLRSELREKSTHELLRELMSLWDDSCLTLGVTMAGCGMPVVCKLWWGGTMCGGNLEDRRLCKSSEWTRVKWGDGAHVNKDCTGLDSWGSVPFPKPEILFKSFDRNGTGLQSQDVKTTTCTNKHAHENVQGWS